MKVRGWPACRAITPVVYAAAIVTAAAGPPVPQETVLGGPSVLLSYLNGASPYSGIGRYEGRATCTAFLLETAPVRNATVAAPAYAITGGHCPASQGSNDVLIDGPGVGRVVFNFFVDSESRQVAVAVRRTAYATKKGQDIAVLELAATYRDLTAQLIRPWPVAVTPTPSSGDVITVVGAPLWPVLTESFLRAARCRADGVAPIVLEHIWHWFDSPFNRCRDMLPGSAGSPIISVTGRVVVGIVNTTTIGAASMTECAIGHPCELASSGAFVRRDTSYATTLAGLGACFDVTRRFNIREPGCPLDPGNQPEAEPPHIGPVNPVLATQPVGELRRTWGVTVRSGQPYYRYAIAQPPANDCRTTSGYSAAISAAAVPVIDRPLPPLEGFTFLCIVGVSSPAADEAAAARAYPTIVVARTDRMAPRLPVQVTITETNEAWRLRFRTVGHEVAFHAYKTGRPMDTRCGDPHGYRFVASTLVGLPRAGGPYRLCIIPYDAAQNPGVVFERVLS